jgi:methyl-accepting chemotaxis protein
MDRSTQQNAAMVEETSAAARNLTSEVHALTQHTARFQIGTGSPVAKIHSRIEMKLRAAR